MYTYIYTYIYIHTMILLCIYRHACMCMILTIAASKLLGLQLGIEQACPDGHVPLCCIGLT